MAGALHSCSIVKKQSDGNTRSMRDVVTLRDLAPRGDVTGGNGRRVFGGEPFDTLPVISRRNNEMSHKINDLQPKRETEQNVKGGGSGASKPTPGKLTQPAPTSTDKGASMTVDLGLVEEIAKPTGKG